MGSGGRPSGGYEYLALSRHHLVPRSLRGDDLDQNLVPLCGDGTSGCHGILTTHPSGWEWTAMRLRLHLNDDELEYVRAKAGAEFLDRYYPLIQGA
jgi:hypothetical protein